MKADLELTLTHDGATWKAYNELYIAEGESFKLLDEQLRESIKSSGSYPEGSRIKVFMGFDSFPFGYKARYFNRCVDIIL
jgi:hypothetical protein